VAYGSNSSAGPIALGLIKQTNDAIDGLNPTAFGKESLKTHARHKVENIGWVMINLPSFDKRTQAKGVGNSDAAKYNQDVTHP